MFTFRNDSDRLRKHWDRSKSRRLRCEPLESRRLLAVVTVDTNQDVVDLDDGVTSLREAIFATNLVADADEIQFDFGHDGPETIVLTMGELVIADSLTIAGLGAELLTVDASGNDPTPEENNGDGSRVFNIDNSDVFTRIDVELHGLTLTGGDVSVSGGAVQSLENLTVTSSKILRNSVASSGGAIASTGSLEIIGSTITGNSAVALGGGVSARRGTMTIINTTISDNWAGRGGGGISANAGGERTIIDSVISRNSAGNEGGGIAARSGTTTITGSIISDNSAGTYGGGIYARAETTIVTDSTISENEANKGGGIWSNRELTVAASTITGNSASDSGGGIRSYSGVATITDSNISGNSAALDGGGIWSNRKLTVAGNTISGNSAGDDGGGIWMQSPYLGPSTITNSTISRNLADNNGGGMYTVVGPGAGSGTIAHSTIVGNVSDADRSDGGSGGGLFVRSGTLGVNHTIVSQNRDHSSVGRDITGFLGVVLDVHFSLIGDSTGTGLAEAPVGSPDVNGNLIGGLINGSISPLLDRLADNGGPTLTHALLPGSPAIDAGDPALVAGTNGTPGYDQRGFPWRRISGARIDIGAFEVQPLPGDFNLDGKADGEDLAIWESNYNLNGDADADGDGLSSGIDFLAWQLMTKSSTEPEPVASNATSAPAAANLIANLESEAATPVIVTTPLDVVDFNDGETSLREAIFATNLVSGADEIQFDFGHDGPETIVLTMGELVISDSLTITGTGAELLTIDASGNDPTPDENNGDGSRIFNIDDGISANYIHVELRGLTLIGGDVLQDGGAIHSRETLLLSNSRISGNSSASYGGGVNARYGSTTIKNSMISKNSAYHGGGGIRTLGATVITGSKISDNLSGSRGGGLWVAFTTQIRDSTISGNSVAVDGGGVYARGLTTFAGSTITDNSADGNGGGIWNTGRSKIFASTISGNSAGDGGGIWAGRTTIYNSTLSENIARDEGGGIKAFNPTTITNSTILGNSADGDGGGIWARITTIIHSTISENTAGDRGGGIWASDDPKVSYSTITNNIANWTGGLFTLDRATVAQSILADNIDSVGTPDLRTSNSGLTLSHSIVGDRGTLNLLEAPVGSPDANGNLIGGPIHGVIDPLLGELADNGGPTFTHALLPGSPAINRGDLNAMAGVDRVPFFDQRDTGFDRVFSGRIDIGAFESQEYSDLNLLVDTVVDESDGDYSRFDLSLREAIELANANPAVDTINFDPILAATLGPLPPTILLTMGELAITDSLTISGPGAELLTIDASGNDPTPDENNGDGSRIFDIDDGSFETLIDVEIRGLTLTGGDESDHGGAIHSIESLYVADSTITGNSSRRDAGGINSFIGTVTITGTTISDNSAGSRGGGIWAEFRYLDSTSIADGAISANSAVDAGSGNWDLDTTSLVIADSTILDNSAGSHGGGILVLGTSKITDSTISNNSASRNGGGIFANGNTTITGSTISNNSASLDNYNIGGNGGGIYAVGSATISDSAISGNMGDRDGGGIYVLVGTTTIINSTISGNMGDRDGGGISGAGDITITDATVSGNSAGSRGGGIFTSSSGTRTITRSTISDNTSGGGAGGIWADDGATTIANSTISDNFASNNAGGIWAATDGTMTIADSSISGNSAGFSGGGIFSTGKTIITRSTVSGNSTDGVGGGIRASGGVGESIYDFLATTITYSTISGNSAGENGGGIWAFSRFTDATTITNSTISGNSADNNGGGMYVDDGSGGEVGTISHSTITANVSDADQSGVGSGGGVFVRSGILSVNHTIIAQNRDFSDVGADVTGFIGAVVEPSFSLIGNNQGSGLLEAAVGAPDAKGNLIGGSDFSTRIDPRLGPLADNGGVTFTHALRTRSPAIDAGDPALVAGANGTPQYDQRGFPWRRISGARIDIGAFEVQPLPGDFNLDGNADGKDLAIWESSYNLNGDADADGDGHSSGIDFLAWQLMTKSSTEPEPVASTATSAPGAANLVAALEVEVATPVIVTTPLDVVEFNDGVTSLREAIFATNLVAGADEIQFDFGHDGPETIVLTLGELVITDSLTITGHGAELLTIDASGNDPTPDENNGDGSRVFNIDDGNSRTIIDVEIRGLTLTGGDESDEAGAIYSEEDLSITESAIIENSTGLSGGGIYAFRGTVSIIDSTVSRNSADAGGGLLVWPFAGAVEIIKSTFSDNRSVVGGGGIVSLSQSLTLVDSRVSGNSSDGAGGGILARGTTTIIDSTISDNSSDGAGGGILARRTTTIIDSTISGNSAGGEGGGLLTSAYTTTVTSSTIVDNASGNRGGGIFSGSVLVVTDSKISGNSANLSGGGIASSSTTSIARSTISGNSAGQDGGGIKVSRINTTIIADSAISGNSAGNNGGGILSASYRSSTTITNSTISGNSADNDGGGIYFLYGGGTVSHSTILGNTSSGGAGGGVFILEDTLVLDHTIVAQNTASSPVGQDITGFLGVVLDVHFSLIGDNRGTGLAEAPAGAPDADGNLIGDPMGRGVIDPFLFPLADNGGPTFTHAPKPFSPVINAGDRNAIAGVDGVPEFDQRGEGFDRVFGDHIDISAFELQESVELNLVVDSLEDEADDDYSRFDLSLREAIEIANALPSSDTIRFDPLLSGGTILLTLGELVVTDDLTINGLGQEFLTISAQQESRIFKFDNGKVANDFDVTLVGLTLTDGRTTGESTFLNDFSYNGGAIRSLTSGQLTIESSTISGNSTTGEGADGGGIFAVGNVTLIQSTVSTNSATGVDADGGGVIAEGDVTLIGSTVGENNGRGISAEGDVTLVSSTVRENNGIGLSARGDVSLVQSTVGVNNGTGISASGDVTLNHSTVSGNSTAGRRAFGGGISANGSVTLIQSTVSGNSTAGEMAFGGGIDADGDVTLNQSTVSGNSTAGPGADGGGIHARGNVTLIQSTVSGNSTAGVGANGGGISGDTVTLDQSTVSGNFTNGDSAGGGGIFARESATLTRSTLSGNRTRGDYSSGGGIAAGGSGVTLNQSTVSGNITASRNFSSGGGIWATFSTISDSTIFGNSSSTDGGGIWSSFATISGSTISNNSADNNGGGVYLRDATTSISHSTITGNVADADQRFAAGTGGGVFIAGGDVNLNHTIVAGNQDNSGGAPDIAGVANSSFSLIGIGAELLGPLADNGGPTLTHALLPGSPAIDAGDPALVADTGDTPKYDQRGFPWRRISGARIDIGAFEVQPLPGDFNLDGRADGEDLAIWESSYNLNGDADADGDGRSSGIDFLAWQLMTKSSPEPEPVASTATSAPGAANLVAALEVEAATPVIVTTPLDVVDFNDGETSLREAIFATNLVAGADEILFDFGHDGPETIVLTLGELAITDSLTITGPGADLLTIDASGNDPTPDEHNGDGSRVFYIDDGDNELQTMVILQGLTLTGGDTDSFQGGGGIYSVEELSILTSKVVENYSSRGRGAGVFAATYGAGGLTIEFSSISNNFAGGNQGGGVYVTSFDSSEVKIDSSSISNNKSGFQGGAGILLSTNGRSTVEITSSEILDNINLPGFRGHIGNGGGIQILARDESYVAIDTTIISGNTAARGGGVYSKTVGPETSAKIEIINSTISQNSGIIVGGVQGNVNYDSEFSLIASSIANNHSVGQSCAGGVCLSTQQSGKARIITTTVSGNTSGSEFGVGGVSATRRSESSSIEIRNSTISFNEQVGSIAGRAGGLFARDFPVELDHTILVGNIGSSGAASDVGGFVEASYSLIGDNTGSGLVEAPAGSPDANGNLIGGPIHGVIDPLLGDLADNGGPTFTHALLPGSPAINRGDLNAMAGVDRVPFFDQRDTGFDRVFGGRIDIGAYESQQYSDLNLLVDTLEDESDGDYSRFDLSLREAIELANANPAVDTIKFDPILAATLGPLPPTILLTMGELEVTDSVKIIGLGEELLTVEAASTASTIFNIGDLDSRSLIDVVITGLTLTGSQGSAIRSTENLTIESSTLRDNQSGAIHVSSFGRQLPDVQLTIRDTTISGNIAKGDGGGVYFHGRHGSLVIEDSTIEQNSAGGDGGGVFASGFDNQIRLDGVAIAGNSAERGGGIFISDDNAGLATIVDSEVTGNIATDGGGGLFLTGKPVNISRTEITNNTALEQSSGGGMYLSALVNVADSTIANNTAAAGGGIWISQFGSLTMTGSVLSGNTAVDGIGGGIGSDRGTVRVRDSQVADNNSSLSSGGGIGVRVGLLTIERSTISGNSAGGDGGGVWARSVTIVDDSTIANNVADGNGGGIFLGSGKSFITSTTISGNSAKGEGGGVLVGTNSSAIGINHSTIAFNSADSDGDNVGRGGGIFVDSGVAKLSHTIVANNTRLDASINEDIAATPGGALFAYYIFYGLIDTIAAGTPATLTDTIVGVDPVLGPLTDNGGPTLTHALLPDSLAINRGNPELIAGGKGEPQHDQRGFPWLRFSGARIDIGAFEVQPLPGDFDLSGEADGEDLAIWKRSYNLNGEADANGDGRSSGIDFLAWQITAYKPAAMPLTSSLIAASDSPSVVHLGPRLADLALAVESMGDGKDAPERLQVNPAKVEVLDEVFRRTEFDGLTTVAAKQSLRVLSRALLDAEDGTESSAELSDVSLKAEFVEESFALL